MAIISPITAARFWSKVSVTPGDFDCWEWMSAKNPNGYGNFRVPGIGIIGAHRVAYCLANGDFPDDGMVVRHKCDNPGCVNPFHLEDGTPSDNMRDAHERGRKSPPPSSGENNAMAKLSEENVHDIRALISDGKSNFEIGRMFGVSHSTISSIRAGKSWRGVGNKPMAAISPNSSTRQDG